MKALVLAAGYATRLYPLTKEYPKPLLKVGGKPIINYIMEKIEVLEDVDEIIVVTNSKFMPKFKKWLSGLRHRKHVSLVDDLTGTLKDRRGAIGDMDFVIQKDRLKDDLLVIGGDNLFDGDLEKFISFVKARRNPAIGAYNIKDMRQAGRYGVIKLDARSRVVDFQEKPHKPNSRLVAMCLYYFPKEKLGLIREYLNPVRNTKALNKKNKISNGVNKKINKHDATGYYIDWLRKRAPVYGFVFNGRWYDIGDRAFYNKAKEEFIRG